MGRRKREVSPEDEWSDMLEPEQMDLWLEAQRCVSMAQSIQGIQAGVVGAAGLVKQYIQPEQFVQLVADQCGTGPPPTNCSLKQMVRWKHKSSDAVSEVTMAVLQRKVDQLRQLIEQRKVRDAEMAANEEKLAAMMLIFQQEMTALHNPASVVALDDGNMDGMGGQEGKEPIDSAAAADTTAIIRVVRAAATMEGTAGESGTPVVQDAVVALSPAAEAVQAAAAAIAERSPVVEAPAAEAAAAGAAAAEAGTAACSKDVAPAAAGAGKRQLAAATTPSTVPAAEVAACAPTAISPPAKRFKAEGQHNQGGTSNPGQQPDSVAAAKPAAAAAAAVRKAATAAAAKAASGKPGSVVVIPGDRSLRQAGLAEAWEDGLQRTDWNRLEAAEEAAAAAAAKLQEQQLSARLQAQGGQVLPPEGFMAASNTHRMFKNRMKVTAYMTPDNVDDKTAGVKAHLDDQLFRFLDDHQVILMSYELLECETGKAFLHPEPPPMLTVQAVADVVTFEPTPGDIICGVVRKLSHNSITLLVLGCISVAIERPFIPADWEYDLNSHCWVPGGDYSKAVCRGDLVTCMLLSYPKLDPDQEEVLFNLEGSLLTANTGLCSWQWPRQQRLRQALAAHNGQAEAYGPEQEQQLQQQQKQLRQQKLTRRKLRPVEEVAAQSSDSEDDDSEDHQQQQQQAQLTQQQQTQQPEQQQDGQLVQQPPAQQPQGKLSKEAKQAQKEAAKQAKREEKERLKAAHKAEKKAAKAAEKAARKAEKAAAKAHAKAEKRAREQQDAAAGEQPPAKKQKHKHEQQQVAAVVQANGHADVQQQLNGKHSSSKDKKDKSEKGSSRKEKSGK